MFVRTIVVKSHIERLENVPCFATDSRFAVTVGVRNFAKALQGAAQLLCFIMFMPETRHTDEDLQRIFGDFLIDLFWELHGTVQQRIREEFDLIFHSANRQRLSSQFPVIVRDRAREVKAAATGG